MTRTVVAEAVYTRPWLYEKQAAAIFAPERYAVIEASSKAGKTVACIAWLFEQAALGGQPGRNYWWIAPTLPVAKIAFRRMKRAIPRALYKANDTDCTIALVNGAVIWFKGADRPDLLYGEDVFAAVMDEATRCKEEAWIALRSTLTATRGPVRIIGNVKGRGNWAYTMARKAEQGSKDMAYFKLTAHDAVEAGVLTAEEIADAKDKLDDAVFRELYLAEASDDGGNPFGLENIKACALDSVAWGLRVKGPVVCWGWDFARAEDYTVGVGLDAWYQVVQLVRFQRPWPETLDDVQRLTGGTYAAGDSTGVGDPLVSELQRRGVPILPVTFTASHRTVGLQGGVSPGSKQKLMEGLRACFHERKLAFPDGWLRAELDAFCYHYTEHSVKYSAPEGLHDDGVMALALAVHARNELGGLVLPPEARALGHPDNHPGMDLVSGHRKMDRLMAGVNPSDYRTLEL